MPFVRVSNAAKSTIHHVFIEQHLLLFVALCALVPLGVILAILIPNARHEAALTGTTKALLTNGRSATVVVTTLRQVNWVGTKYRGYFLLEVTFTLEGQPRTSQCLVAPVVRPSVIPGSSLPIRYDPAQLALIAIDVEKLGYPQAP